MKLSSLAERLTPYARSYTKDQADALHEYADLLAKDLTSGNFMYTPRG